MLDVRIKTALSAKREQFLEAGELLTPERLKGCYDLFRRRFGPEVLSQLDGEELLNTMHAHGSKDSLVYWLEFKDDEEMPAKFGSIAGGSALKFGIYRRKETGVWMKGSPSKQEEIEISEAVDIARQHRDQLIAGAGILQALPENGADEDYAAVQSAMDEQAPDVSRSAWGHKYFSLLFSNKLDDYHAEDYQRFHLIKMLQKPPEGSGRFLVAGLFVRIARELEWPLNHLTSVLNQADGRPYRVWRVGTDIGGTDSIWEFMREQNCVAVGGALLGDLSALPQSKESKEHLRDLFIKHYDRAPNVASRKAGEYLNFAAVMNEGDPVLAASGQRVLGVGRIAGPYQFDLQVHEFAPHFRRVDWKSLDEFALPVHEGLRTTVYPIRKSVDVLIETERQLLEERPSEPSGQIRGPIERLDGVAGRVQAVLERKGQVILYGPPGTGKTYWAQQAGLDLAALKVFGRRFEQLDSEQQIQIKGGSSERGLFRICTFHPAYGYEDFVEGYRPTEGEGGALHFALTNGIFKQLCIDAENQPARPFYLLVDEINRGDIPRIFGELLTLLEKDKREQEVSLAVSGSRFRVPENVYLIGTMNTADRSIALLDTALRRRFGFIELMPDPAILGDAVVAESIPLGPWLAALNDRIRDHIGRDARNLQVGHSYLMHAGKPVSGFRRFVQVLADDIVPLLEEYCYEDYATLARILGPTLIDENRQRVRRELLVPERRDDLVQALLAPSPEISTSQVMVAQPETDDTDEEDDGGEEEGVSE